MKIELDEKDLRPGTNAEAMLVRQARLPEAIIAAASEITLRLADGRLRVLKCDGPPAKGSPKPADAESPRQHPANPSPYPFSDSAHVLQELVGGKWINPWTSCHLNEAVAWMAQRDGVTVASRRILRDSDGAIVAIGRHGSPDTIGTERFSLVMALDKPGPMERGERDRETSKRHASQADAIKEARRLSQAASGGRFGVLTLTHVTGWIDAAVTDENADQMPF